MRRLVLLGLLAALPLAAVPLVWAAASGGGSRDGVCSLNERADRLGLTGSEPSAAPVRWDVHKRAVPADRLGHNLRHGGVAVEYGALVPDDAVRRIVAWYRRDPVAVVVTPRPELGSAIVLDSWSASARCRSFDEAAFSDFRATRRFGGPESPPRAELTPTRPVESLQVTSRRIGFVVAGPAGVTVVIRDADGRAVRSLGHFSVPARQRLVLSWDERDDAGRRLPAGRYAAVVTTDGPEARAFRAPFTLG